MLKSDLNRHLHTVMFSEVVLIGSEFQNIRSDNNIHCQHQDPSCALLNSCNVIIKVVLIMKKNGSTFKM
jgi:hypothetical protein